jgi:hypothetical protein
VSRSGIVFCIVHITSTQERPFPVGFSAIPVAYFVIEKQALLRFTGDRYAILLAARRGPTWQFDLGFYSAGKNSSR